MVLPLEVSYRRQGLAMIRARHRRHARIRPPQVSFVLIMAACMAALFLAGCRPGTSAAEVPPAQAKDKDASEAEGVTLKPEEIEKAGIKTATLAAVGHTPESTGYAVVITRETIAQALADLTSAAAVARQSRSALTRARSLAGTPGAMPIEAQETAERQAAVDHVALVLAERRLSATYGQSSPWKENYTSPLLTALARGDSKLARVTFPLGALGSTVPSKLRLTRISAAPGTKSIETLVVWSAPADATIPGRSFFAIFKDGDASEGERLIAYAAVGAAETGIIVPYSATIISASKYWCYVEEKPGFFARTEIDPGMPTDDGYFVRKGPRPGAQVVISGAGLLLARETNPSTEAE